MCNRSTVLGMNQTESKATRLKFHEESSDNLFIFTTVATQCYGTPKNFDVKTILQEEKPFFVDLFTSQLSTCRPAQVVASAADIE
jgi:hypothetical protein